MFRRATLLGVLLACTTAYAEVVEVFIWDPLPGVANSQPQLYENGMKAKAIHEKHGAAITVARDQMGQMHYAVAHENYAAMNKFYNGVNADPANAAFWKEGNANPVADLVEQYVLDVVAGGEAGPIYEVFIWQPLPGKVSATIESAMGAKPIHEKAGVKVSILMDRINRMHYVLYFDSWEQHAKFWDTPIPEFQAYMEKVSENPAAELVKTYRGASLQP